MAGGTSPGLETDEALMSPPEWLAWLNDWIDAGRAGVKAALAGRKAAETEAMGSFITGLRDDEARWCAMLAGQIKRLGGSPSGACGAFYDKVMALDEPVERLALLNRGPGWVGRKPDAVIPRRTAEVLRADLRELADSTDANIAETAQHIPDPEWHA